MGGLPEELAILPGQRLLEFGQQLRGFLKIGLDQFVDKVCAHGFLQGFEGGQINDRRCAHGSPLC